MHYFRCLAIVLILATTSFAWQTAVEETFDGDWTSRWGVTGSIGSTDGGVLKSNGRELIATLQKPINAPAIRVSFDATMTTRPDADTPSDLSLYIGDVFFQFGGDANSVTIIKSIKPIVADCLTSANTFSIHLNKTHKIIAEVNGLEAVLKIDGQVAAHALLTTPINAAQIQLYAWSGIAVFDNVTIETKSVADPTPQSLINAVAKRAEDAAARTRHHETKPATIGELRIMPTIHSVGIEWDIVGDGNHNAVSTLRYRKPGSAWREALAPLRIDYRAEYTDKRVSYRHFNMFAGSLMFLDPGQTYELQLTIHDPDGGDDLRTITTTTRTTPIPNAPLRTLHVIPGEGGGIGTVDDPLRGIAAADKIAKPGDLFLLHPGRYTRHTLAHGGDAACYVTYKATDDGNAEIVGHLGISAGKLWFEGLTFVTIDDDAREFGGIRGKATGLNDVVIVRNTFRNTRYGVSNTEREWNGDPDLLNRRWYIADNDYEGGAVCEYFTRVYMLADGDICYNRVSTTLNGKGGDGISVRFCTNMDIYHNDLQQIDDDHFEPDSAYGNIRIWRNRARISQFETVSFQPQLGSPWYIVQNEIAQFHPRRYGKVFKTNYFDRNVIVGNTFVVRGRYCQYRADMMLAGYLRNNLWIHIYDNPSQATNAGGAVWYGGSYLEGAKYLSPGLAKADWRSDVDYEGFAWDDIPDMRYPLWWGGKRLETPAALGELLGIGSHLVRVQRDNLFTVDDLLAYANENYPSQRLTLKPGSAAIDAGTIVPGLIDDYTGKAPDLGAYELGAPMRHYGPRN